MELFLEGKLFFYEFILVFILWGSENVYNVFIVSYVPADDFSYYKTSFCSSNCFLISFFECCEGDFDREKP